MIHVHAMKTSADYRQKAEQAVSAGELGEAEQYLKQARELFPSDSDIWQLSIQVNGRLGHLQTAIACCEHLLALNCEDVVAWGFLGTARLAAGRHQDAIEAFDRALELSPDTPMVLINRGCALFQLDKYTEALSSLNRAVQLDPLNVNAQFNLARVYKSQGRLTEAIDALKKTLKLDPGHVEAHTSLGDLLLQKGSLTECRQAWLNALSISPDQIRYRYGLAKFYSVNGEYDNAIEQYEIIRRIRPGDMLALCGQADVLEKKDCLDEAYEVVRKLLAANVQDVALADIFGRLCRRFNACDEAIRYHASLLGSKHTDEELSNLYYSLGRIYDCLGQYDEAFSQFEEANRLCRYRCDMEEKRRTFSDMRACFSRSNIRTLPGSRNLSQRPVFVLGMPRSGTTLVEQIIASHPDAYGAGELPDVKRITVSLPMLCGRGAPEYPHCMHLLDEEKMNRVASAYLDRLQEYNSECARVVDKMPHNFIHVGLLCLLFSHARIIHCAREPADTCFSIYSRPLISAHAYGTDLRTLGQYYCEYKRLMAHWREVFPGRMYEIRYEDLVSDQERYSRELIEYCGLEWDDRCLEFFNSKRTVITASYAQVRRPIYRSSIKRWRNYERHLQPLLQELHD